MVKYIDKLFPMITGLVFIRIDMSLTNRISNYWILIESYCIALNVVIPIEYHCSLERVIRFAYLKWKGNLLSLLLIPIVVYQILIIELSLLLPNPSFNKILWEGIFLRPTALGFINTRYIDMHRGIHLYLTAPILLLCDPIVIQIHRHAR